VKGRAVVDAEGALARLDCGRGDGSPDHSDRLVGGLRRTSLFLLKTQLFI
jgi:hypothetical protein